MTGLEARDAARVAPVEPVETWATSFAQVAARPIASDPAPVETTRLDARGESRRPRLRCAAALLVCDAAGLLAGCAAAVALLAPGAFAERLLAMEAVGALALGAAIGLYPGFGLHAHEVLRRRACVAAAAGGCAAAVAAILLEDLRGAASAVGAAGIALAVQWALRRCAASWLRRRGLWGQRAAVLGDGPDRAAASRFLEANWRIGLIPAPSRDAPRLALHAGPAPSPAALKALRARFDEVWVLADLPGAARSGFGAAAIGGAVGIRLAGPRRPRASRRAMRAIDLVVACAALAVTAPLMALVALALQLADPGPVFYRQTRIGEGGKPFEILKLRTMYVDAERRLEALLASDPEARAEWEAHFKLRRDPRVPPGFGRAARATSLDELPQLLNVIAGEMSLVGPRPFPHYHLAAMTPSFRAERETATPGLTGVWQISDRSGADVRRVEELDGFYLANRSFWLDAQILLATPEAVLFGGGAY